MLRALLRPPRVAQCAVAIAVAGTIAAVASAAAGVGFTPADEKPQPASGYPAPKFGGSVAISSDGSTAVAGGFGDDGGKGAAWFLAHDAAGWHELQKIANAGTVGAAWFGAGVAMSADGRTAIVGAPLDNVNVGSAWVYARSGGEWQQQAKLTGSDPSSTVQDGFGQSIAVSSDGSTAIVGAYTYNGTRGAAFTFQRQGTTWSRLGSTLTGAGERVNGFYGSSVALSADGQTALVGAPDDNEGVGAAWAYARSASGWTQIGRKLVPHGAAGHSAFGCSVALSADGRTAIVGGCRDHGGIGAAWILTRTDAGFVSSGAKLTGPHERGRGAFGYSVSIASNGRLALVGAPDENRGRGSVWVFVRATGGRWTARPPIRGTGGSLGFAVSLAADGKTAVAGAPNAGKGAGAAWSYTTSR